jgi:hypothetical protein
MVQGQGLAAVRLVAVHLVVAHLAAPHLAVAPHLVAVSPAVARLFQRHKCQKQKKNYLWWRVIQPRDFHKNWSFRMKFRSWNGLMRVRRIR